jgi:integrase
MMLATGCRIGECLAIGWSEVDLDAEEVGISGVDSRTGGRPRCWTTCSTTQVGRAGSEESQ